MNGRGRWVALLAIMLAARLRGAECVTCHPAEVKLHEKTSMARAMLPVAASPFGENLPATPLHDESNDLDFSFHRTLAGVEVTVTRGDDKATGVIEWVLGRGSQGETALVRGPGGIYESRMSYFPQLHQYGVTIGQDERALPFAADGLGRLQSSRELQACLGCHATAVTRELEPVIPGIQCVRCHAGAEEHAKGGGKAPFNPGKLAAAEQVLFCGNCHRSKPPRDEGALENVRFQPLRLMKSRCFTAGQLECTTCHVAHQDARRNDPEFYNEKCQSCHSGGARQIAHTDARRSGNCIGCHMPNVKLHPALRFTDHYIRVVSAVSAPGSLTGAGRGPDRGWPGRPGAVGRFGERDQTLARQPADLH